MRKQLTAVAVKNLRPGRTRREIRDGGAHGLYLLIQPSGAKSWALRFRRPGGKSAKFTLGPVDLTDVEIEGEPVIGQPLTLASARRLASEVHRQRAMGRDVVADTADAKSRREFEREAHAKNTFAAAVHEFIEQYARKRQRRWREMVRLLGLRSEKNGNLEVIRGGLIDRWADKPVAEIDGHDIYNVIDEVRRVGVPGLKRRSDKPTDALARLVLVILSKLFGWLVQHRRIPANPCAGVHRPELSPSRDRVLNNSEIVKFWSAASAERAVFSVLLKLLLLTGCRRSEVAGMRRGELSEDGTTWTIPGERTKNKKAHVVPLPPLARELIASVDPHPFGDLVFTTTGTRPIGSWPKIKQRLDTRMHIPPWRLHDLRRTAATGMAELGIAPHIVEACLNHVSGAKAGVAGVYNRAAYAPEKKAALERWASHVAGLVEGHAAKVVPLRGSTS